MYVFCDKREKILINIINFGKKLAMLYKKINSEVVYNKRYIKHENKESFQNSVYRKDENYFLKMFLEKFDFDKDVEIYSNNSYYVDSDEKH